MKPIGIVLTCGIIIGNALTEILNKSGGAIVRVELPVWVDVLIFVVALLIAIWATAKATLE